MTFGLKIFEKISKFHNKIAISSGSKEITYELLNEISLKIASTLIISKLNNQVVGIIGQRNFSVYYGILGAIYSGCTYVPINDKYTQDKIKKIIIESNISILIGNGDSFKRIINLLDLRNIKTIIMPEEKKDPQTKIFPKSLKIFYQEDILNQKKTNPINTDPSDSLYILFTSGSTGNPKGVMVTNKNIECFINNFQKSYNLQIGYKSSQTFDLGFDPSVVDMFMTWLNGGQLCLLSESELLMPYEYIKREKLNFWYSVPALIKFMFKMNYLIPNSFPELKYSIFTGEALPKYLCDAWQIAAPNSIIENGYGPTEATVNISKFFYKREYKNREYQNNILPIGHIFEDHSFAFVDENFKKVEDKGHLVIKGGQISKGYLNDPDKTNISFRKFNWDKSNETWYLTGDKAFINEFSEIEYLGRIDDQIKILGRRIELGEIEAALKKSGLVNEVIVVPKKDINGIIISLTGFINEELSEQNKQIINKIASKFLEKIFIPKEYIFIEKFPITNSGKTDRKKLSEIARTYYEKK